MFDEEKGAMTALTPGRVFLQQTSAAVYVGPSADSEVAARLQEGAPFDILPTAEEAGAAWISVQTVAGQRGFIRSGTKTTTPERLRAERETIQRGYAIGQGKMAMGGAIFLFGAATLVYSLFFANGQKEPFVVYYIAIAGGAGEFLWGLEQIAQVRSALNKFDTLWRKALQ